MMNIQQYEPVPDDGQSTVSKAADIAIWYKNEGTLHTRLNHQTQRTRFDAICELWDVSKGELNIEMGGRA